MRTPDDPPANPPEATIDVYLDFQCPARRQFEQLTGPTVDQLQPAEGLARAEPDRPIQLGGQAGAGPGFAACVRSGRYEPWAAEVTDQASKEGLPGTPTMKANGREIATPTPDAVRSAAAAAAAQG